MIDNGIDIRSRNNDGNEARDLAREMENKPVLEVLEKRIGGVAD